MTIMKVHYSPTDGIPLNSLYLKETSTTERSGSVLGGGHFGRLCYSGRRRLCRFGNAEDDSFFCLCTT